MMMQAIKILFIISFIFIGCTHWKSLLSQKGDESTAIRNAITDFVNTSSLSKRENTFGVSVKNIDDEILSVSITGTINKFYVVKSGKSSILPTNYLEYDSKLFYWHDDANATSKSNQELYEMLDKYDLIDTVPSIAFIEFINDDSKVGIDYYFCMKNLLKYRKIRTTNAAGYYPLPNITCPN